MSRRLYYFDALRSFCMLFGIFVHTGTLDGGSGLSKTVFWVSDHFRMAVFFLISGFFAVLVLEKYGQGGFLRRRLIAMLVPLVTGLILLNPLANWLIYVDSTTWVGFGDFLAHNLPMPPVRSGSWHLHLWFLVSLAIYVLITPLAVPVLRSKPMQRFGQAFSSLQGDVIVILLAIAMVLGEMVGRIVYGAALEPFVRGGPAAWVCRATLQYAPYFLLGLYSYTLPGLFEKMHRVSWPALAIGVGLNIALWLGGNHLHGFSLTFGEVVAEEFLTFAVATTLFALFRRYLSHQNPVTTALNASVYTVYLWHFLLIYAFALFVFPSVTWFPALFVLVSVSVFVTAFALDRLVIARVPLLLFLFNGKTAPVRVARQA